MDQQTGAELVKTISDIVTNNENHGISITFIVSRNAAALKTAIKNTAFSNFTTL